jgi:hypothetical protein
VFDNVEGLDSLRNFLPKSIAYEGSTIITTQMKRVASVFREAALLVEGWSQTEGLGFLLRSVVTQQTTTDAESKELMELSRQLGGLPLAIADLAGYAAMQMVSFRDILDLWAQAPPSPWINSSDPTSTALTFQYDKTLNTGFMMAWEELPEQALLALRVMAFLDPDEIAEEMLFKLGSSGTSPLWTDLHR